MINYGKISHEFGFHKWSFDWMHKWTWLLSPLGMTSKDVHRISDLINMKQTEGDFGLYSSLDAISFKIRENKAAIL